MAGAPTDEVKELWREIHALLAQQQLPVLEQLLPGASESQLAELEASLGAPLHRALQESLRVHNGQLEGSVFMNGYRFLSAEEIFDDWDILRNALPPTAALSMSRAGAKTVRSSDSNAWCPAWLPFMMSDGDGFFCHAGTGAVRHSFFGAAFEGKTHSSMASWFRDCIVLPLQTGSCHVADGELTVRDLLDHVEAGVAKRPCIMVRYSDELTATVGRESEALPRHIMDVAEMTEYLERTRPILRSCLFMSYFFKQHRQQYYEHLQAVRDEGAWEAWLAFFLRGVVDVSQQATDTVRRVLALREDHRRIITEQLGRAAGNGHRVLEYLYDHPIVSVHDVQNLIGTSYPAANGLVARMWKLGILKESTGHARNRRFTYQSYIQLFHEDAPE